MPLEGNRGDAGAHPLVSVVIPAYNHEAYVQQAIESVLAQDYREIELIVVDDGSRDRTWEQICELRNRTTRPFKAIRQENAGVSKTLNRGIAESSGAFIGLLASDDYYLPGKISRQVALLANGGPDVALVHASALLDYQNGLALEDMTGSRTPARGRCFHELLMQEVRIIPPTVLFRRTAFDAIGGFDEALAGEDLDFYLRLTAAGYLVEYDSEPLVVKRVTAGSLGSRLRDLVFVGEQIIEKHRRRLDTYQYERLLKINRRNVIALAARCGDFELAWGTATRESVRCRSLRPVASALFWTAWSVALRSTPSPLRHRLRITRAALRNRIAAKGRGGSSE